MHRSPLNYPSIFSNRPISYIFWTTGSTRDFYKKIIFIVMILRTTFVCHFGDSCGIDCIITGLIKLLTVCFYSRRCIDCYPSYLAIPVCQDVQSNCAIISTVTYNKPIYILLQRVYDCYSLATVLAIKIRGLCECFWVYVDWIRLFWLKYLLSAPFDRQV